MSVPAPAAKLVTAPANLGYRDVRDGGAASAGTFAFEIGEEVVTGWHFHDLHQLEYAFEGVAQVETASARYLLPPQQAVWIPAGVEHCTTLGRVRTLSVFSDPEIRLEAGDRVRLLPAAPVIREMILYERRWPIGRVTSDPVADAFFGALGQLVIKELDHEIALCLPTSREPLIATAMAFTQENLAEVTLGDLCRAVCSNPYLYAGSGFGRVVGDPWTSIESKSGSSDLSGVLARGRDGCLTREIALSGVSKSE